jgi:hypothetical protein
MNFAPSVGLVKVFVPCSSAIPFVVKQLRTIKETKMPTCFLIIYQNILYPAILKEMGGGQEGRPLLFMCRLPNVGLFWET